MSQAYKQIPLGNLARFIRGITFKPDDKVLLHEDDAVVCMRTKNVQTRLDENDLIAIPSEFVKRKEQYLAEGDILVSSANSWELVGKCCSVPKLKYKATAGGFISILRADQNRIFPRYLYFWASSGYTQHLFRHCGRQTTNISNMDFNRALKLEIPIPYTDTSSKSIAEQKRIAGILDQADAIRKKHRQAIDELNNLIPAVFYDMFGDPVANPHKWKVERFSDCCEEKPSNGFFAKNTEYGQGTPIVWISDFIDKMYVSMPPDKKVKCTDKDVEAYRLKYGDVLFCRSSLTVEGIGKVSVVPEGISRDVIFECHIIRAPLDTSIMVPEFFQVLSFTPWYRSQIMSNAKTATMTTISQGGVLKTLVIVPPVNLQREFLQKIKEIQKLKAMHEQSDVESDDLFNSLIQQAFKGEL